MESEEHEDMSIKDRLFLDPISKYQKYGNFPWKMIIHLLLLFFTCIQIMLIVVESAAYNYNQYVVWNQLFLVRGVSGDSTQLTYNYYVFGVGDLISYFSRTIDHYYNINDHTVDTYQLHTNDKGNVKPIKMYVSYLENKAVKVSITQNDGFQFSYNITEGDYGPLSLTNAKDFLDHVQSFYLEMKIKHELPEKVILASNCFEWTIRQFYDYSLHGPINISLDLDVTVCSDAFGRYMRKFAWVNLLVIFLALISLGIIWTYLVSRAILIRHIRGTDSRDWQHLTLTEKIKFINPWVFLTFVGNVLQIFGSIMFFLVVHIPMKYFDIVVGLGNFCAWLNLLRYLEPYPNAYTVVNTFKRAFPILWRYIVGILPLFMAFCFLSMALFWKTQYYNNISAAMLANFALLNGDSVYMFFSSAVGVNFFWGFVWMYSFIVFFICCVHNIFIAIIGEGFTSLRKNPPRKGGNFDEDDALTGPTTPPMIRQMSMKVSSPKLGVNSNHYTEQKSMAVYRRILHNQTVTQDQDPTELAMSQIDRVKEEIRKKIARLKELANPPDTLEADAPALKAHLQSVLSGDKIQGTIATIVHDIKSAP